MNAPLTPANAVRDIARQEHRAAQERLSDEGIHFHDAALAARWEMLRQDLRHWEQMGQTKIADDVKFELDELMQQDDTKRQQSDAWHDWVEGLALATFGITPERFHAAKEKIERDPLALTRFEHRHLHGLILNPQTGDYHDAAQHHQETL